MLNPAAVAANRQARLVREASQPVYTTRTGDRPQWVVQREVNAAHAKPKHHNGEECKDC